MPDHGEPMVDTLGWFCWFLRAAASMEYFQDPLPQGNPESLGVIYFTSDRGSLVIYGMDFPSYKQPECCSAPGEACGESPG